MDIRTRLGSSNYLKAVDLQGQAVRVTIRECADETVGIGRQAEDKGVLYFQNKDKGLVLNTTNGNTIGEAIGWETVGWPGHEIELYPTTTDYQGKVVDCIRVRIPAKPTVAVAAAPAPEGQPGDDQIPF